MKSNQSTVSKAITDLESQLINTTALTWEEANNIGSLISNLKLCKLRSATALEPIKKETFIGFLLSLLKVLRYHEALTNELSKVHKLASTVPTQQSDDHFSWAIALDTRLKLLRMRTEPASDDHAFYHPTPLTGIRMFESIQGIDSEMKRDYDYDGQAGL